MAMVASILRVNLSTRQITRQPTPPELARDYHRRARLWRVSSCYKEVPQGRRPAGPGEQADHLQRPALRLDDPRGGQVRLDDQVAPDGRLCQLPRWAGCSLPR